MHFLALRSCHAAPLDGKSLAAGSDRALIVRPRIFVINLARSPDRRRVVTGRLRELGLDHEFFPALDGATLTEAELANYDRRARLEAYGCDLLPNELGCYLSHYRLYEKIIAQNIPRALILEDDVEISDDLPLILDALADAPDGWELVRLSGLRARKGRTIADIAPGYRMVRLLDVASGAQAYLLNRRGAQKLVAYGRKITRQVDVMIDRYWDNGLRIMAVQPYPVRPSDRFESTIGPPQTDAWRAPGMRRLRLRIKAAKTVDSLRKRLLNLRIRLEPRR